MESPISKQIGQYMNALSPRLRIIARGYYRDLRKLGESRDEARMATHALLFGAFMQANYGPEIWRDIKHWQ